MDPDLTVESLIKLLGNNDSSVKKQCLEYVLLLSSKDETCKIIFENYDFIRALFEVLLNSSVDISVLIFNILINISSFQNGALAVYEADMDNEGKSKNVLHVIKYVLDPHYPLSDRAAKVLTNMTISEDLALRTTKMILSNEFSFSPAFQAARNKDYNSKGVFLSQHLCQLFCNLTQSTDFQKYLLSTQEGHLFCSILPVLNNGETRSQKRGIAATVYNCMFNSENHLVLLNSPFNILGYILYPLAGPEEFEEDEVDKMPIEVQYLENDKKREDDPEIRKLLLKSLLMLCDTKAGRSFLRDKQVYLILREYHKWEKDASLILACENVVDILIRTEEEIGIDDLRSIDVPDDLKQKFEKMDHEFVNGTSDS